MSHDNWSEILRPRAYDLATYGERVRLLREVSGYLLTCRRQHHGTDMEGRLFAIEALELWLVELDLAGKQS